MSPDALRARFLLAMGLSATSLGGCSKAGPVQVPSGDSSTVATTTSPPPIPLGPGDGATGFTLHPTGGGGCGLVVQCDPPSKTPVKAPPPAPYERCLMGIPHVEGSRTNEPATFDATVTAARTAERKLKPGELCCYAAPRGFCGGGRPLLAERGPVLAPLLERSDWQSAEVGAGGAARPDLELAERFLQDAAFEHASVASFARASLQLMALGAPAKLVDATHTAARDEVRHARVCFTLAARRGARGFRPGALPVDDAPLLTTASALARETLLGGCVAETRAALDVRARSILGDAVERAELWRIADDEERHAELAFQTLAWVVHAFGAEAREPLREVVRSLDPHDEVVRLIVAPCVSALLAEDERRSSRDLATHV